MRADAREGDGLCLRPSPTAIGPAAYGHRLQTPPRLLRPRGMLSADVDAFVDAVLAELAAMAADGTRPTRSGPKPPLTGAALRKAIMAIWCVCFCGMQWRAIGQLCDIPFGTLYTLFARWTRLAVAPPAQPLDPGLAAGLRRHCRPQRRHHRQPLLSARRRACFGARLRWRQEDQGHQDPSRGR